MIDVEICIDCTNLTTALKSAEAALEGGARRIECCKDMVIGGTTPDLTILQKIVDLVGGKIEVVVMIRPRGGDFTFNRTDRMTMLTDAQQIIALGVDGIVFGSLDGDRVDEVLCEEIALYASYNGVKNTFHRAFDALSDPFAALEFLEETRFQRVLTSGTAWGSSLSAVDGLSNIKEFASEFPRLEFVVGGGVSSENVQAIVQGMANTKFSLHAYSSVLENGVTSAEKVKHLVELAQKTR
ncbi:MAG: copper homeostasis protein CutC [Bacteroidetes bacterium]|nr:copper homeostasis protein CutC [Bacteroidota bacterium]